MKRLMALAVLASVVVGCNDTAITPLPSATPPIVTPSGPGTTAEPGTTAQPGETPDPGTPTQPPSGMANLIAASVQIAIYTQGATGPTLAGRGSGTIITPDGLILTNAHVAAPDAGGLAIQYGDIGQDAEPAVELRVLMTENEDEAPIPRYKAELVTVDGYLDIAVIRITRTIDDAPVSGLQLPTVPLGDSDALRIGDPITVVGFPGIGGNTVSANNGEVSGFLDDAKIGPRGWIKTSAIVHHGNSGGLAANSAGELVGVPTRHPDTKDPSDIGGYELVRPIAQAQPVIDAALSGEQYLESRFVHAGTGQEQMQFVGWLREGATDCDAGSLVASYPTGTGSLSAAFRWSGFASGEDFGVLWAGQPEGSSQTQLLDTETSVWELGESGDCVRFSLAMRSPFPNGVYAVLVGVGPHLAAVASAQTTVGGSGGPGGPGGPIGPGPGAPTPGPQTPGPATPAPTTGPGTPTLPDPSTWILLGGRIIDATTGLPIQDAYVLVFLPGVDPIAWLNDPDADDNLWLSDATTDEEGRYVMNYLLPPSTQLPILVVARGYQAWSGALTTGPDSGLIQDIGLAPGAP